MTREPLTPRDVLATAKLDALWRQYDVHYGANAANERYATRLAIEAEARAEADAQLLVVQLTAESDRQLRLAAVKEANVTIVALAEALQATILTSPGEYMGPGMGAYRTPYADLKPDEQRHVQRDATALAAAMREGAGMSVLAKSMTDPQDMTVMEYLLEQRTTLWDAA